MEALIMTGQLLLGLSILVGVHEFGHLIAAKAFGMRVEKYSIGFPPKIWGKQFGETEYSIGAIPLGGFVKISGMIDESMDVESMKKEPQPWEFRSKPAWQRLIVMLGGIIVNVITGVVIFICLTYYMGESFLTKDELNKHGIVALELGRELGLKTGDKIVNISGKDYEDFMDLRSPDVLLSTNGFYTVERQGEVLTVPIPSDMLDKFADNKDAGFIEPRRPFVVGQVMAGSRASQGGLVKGDKFVAVNGTPVSYYDQLKGALDTLQGRQIVAKVDRGGETIDLYFTVNDDATLGFVIEDALNYSFKDYSFGESVGIGSERAFSVVWTNAKAFGKMFSGEVSPQKSLSGPIGIAQFFGGEWDWINFWRITGLLSMVLAFMNLLPIPALDGGHVMFLLWEMVTGRKPSDKFLESAQKVGMVLLLGIMGFVILNDVYKLF